MTVQPVLTGHACSYRSLKQNITRHSNCPLWRQSISLVFSASTRKVYEKKLQKLLDEHAAEPAAPTDVTTLPKADSNQNGNTNSDHYSDKEDGEH